MQDSERIKADLEADVLDAAADAGIETIFFRNALAKKLGLTLTESLCLTILGVDGASTPTELARFVGLTTGSMTTMLDRLEKRRFVRRRPNPSDRRGIIVEIDVAYGDSAGDLVAGVQKAHRDLISTYSREQLLVIADFLRGFAKNLRTHAESGGDDASQA